MPKLILLIATEQRVKGDIEASAGRREAVREREVLIVGGFAGLTRPKRRGSLVQWPRGA